MNILRSVIVAVLHLLLAASLAAQSTCSWNAELVRDWVRSPIQMDIHAGYRIFAFRSDGTVGYRVRAEYPYAAFVSFTIYENALLRSALTDHQIDADPGSTNPFLAGQLVHAPKRWYTVTVLPEPPGSKEPNISFQIRSTCRARPAPMC